MPPSDVVSVYESLAISFTEKELVILKYFETDWIGEMVGGMKTNPNFDIFIWNLVERFETGSTRTTNAL